MDMTVVDGSRNAGHLARVPAILLRPNSAWKVIDGEVATIPGLLIGYAGVLAAFRAVCTLIGGQLYGFGLLGMQAHPSLDWSLRNAIAGYVLTLVSALVLGLLIDALAPSFGARKNLVQAMKLAVYSGTAGWVGAVLWLIPGFGLIAVLCGLYGLYLLYGGLPKLMKPPLERERFYATIVLFFAVVINLAGAEGVAMIAGPATGPAMVRARGGSGVVTVDGQEIDVRRLQAAARAARASEAVDPEKLKAFVPDHVDGIPRNTLTSQPAIDSVVSASSVEAVYAEGGAHITLSIADLKAMGPYASLMGAIEARSPRRTPGAYEKIREVDGRLTVETWDRDAKSGRYRTLVANRFMVEARGAAPSIDVLKAAVAAVGPDRLEALAKS
jgi:hypothetical protein